MTFVVERRSLDLATASVQLRENQAGNPTFFGHTTTFNQRYAIGNPLTWGFYEEVATGAANKTVQEGDQRFLIDHDTYYLVARRSAGNLRVSIDSVGVAYDADLNTKVSYVNDLIENLNAGNYTGMSMGFRVIKDEWTTETIETSDGNSAEVEIRTILELQIIEGSVVSFPANEGTDAAMRGEQRSVAEALVARGDIDAFEKRSAHIRGLEDFRHLFEPRESTQTPTPEPSGLTPDDLARRMRAISARYALPLTEKDTVA